MESKKINLAIQKIWKVSKMGQSITFNSLTVSSMQQSRMKSHRIGHQSSKRKPVLAYLYTKTKNKPIKMTNSTSTDVILQVHGAIEW